MNYFNGSLRETDKEVSEEDYLEDESEE